MHLCALHAQRTLKNNAVVNFAAIASHYCKFVLYNVENNYPSNQYHERY